MKNTNIKKDNVIELSVGLPVYRGKHIAWLALESLCRQKMSLDIKWELVIIEEEYECFSEEKFMEYAPRLEEVGCSRISYSLLKKWIPLSEKWKMIGDKVSDTSQVFALHAADNYSQPYRLIETYNIIIKENYDWVSSPMGPFYDIPTGTLVVHDKRHSAAMKGLNQAIKTQFVKVFPDASEIRGLDSYFTSNSIRYCKEIEKRKFINKHNTSENWRYGIFTNGLNNLTKGRLEQMRGHKNFNRSIKMSIDEILPPDIVERLKDCKQYCREEYVKGGKKRKPKDQVVQLGKTYKDK